jgi:hypothetical protein
MARTHRAETRRRGGGRQPEKDTNYVAAWLFFVLLFQNWVGICNFSKNKGRASQSYARP